MANKRIKDLGTTASTLAADDYVAIDGNANGTRKIVKGDLVNDISTQVAGTYLDEANNLSDVASKDTSKLNLEVPDVGTAPNEVPLNGQLGSLAYQSADSVAMGTVSADEIGVGTSDPDYEIEAKAANARIAATSDGGVVNHLQSNSTTGFIGTHTNHPLALKTNGSTRATVTAAGLVGVNQTSPTAQLQVDQPASDQSGAAAIKAVGTAYGTNKAIHGYMNTSSSTKSLLYLENGSGSVVNVQGDGLVGIGQSSPVGKLEVAVTPTTSATTVNETADFADSAIISNGGTSANGDRIPLVFNVGNSGANGISAAIVGERESSGWNTALSFWTNGVTSGAEGTDAIQEAMRIDSQGRLGVNQTAPSTNANSIADDLVVGNTGQASGITVVGGTGSTSAMAFGSGGTTIKGGMVYDHPSNSLQFSANSATRWLINSSGNLQANGAYGIDFGSGANSTISSYEIGTWTPALSTGTGESITYAGQVGDYTKIGNIVYCSGKIQISSAATYGSANHLQIGGLPFTAENSSRGISFSYGGGYGNNSLFQVGDITGAQPQSNGASSFYLQRGQYGGTSDVYYRVALLNTTGYLLFSLTYETAQ